MDGFKFTDADFRTIASRLEAQTGIKLSAQKRPMVYARLTKRLRALRLPDFKSYLDFLDGPEGDAEQQSFINALTTNLTSFFRESHHFEHLSTWISAQNNPLRFWSAGCSSGPEPYCIAMTLLSQPSPPKALILATDLDTQMLSQAAAGRYPPTMTKTIPTPLLRRFFTNESDGSSKASNELRNLIRFNQLNLLERWPIQEKFDAIFCRNVLIYFDKQTQHKLIQRFSDLLKPKGWLYLGHSENAPATLTQLQPVGRTIYQKVTP